MHKCIESNSVDWVKVGEQFLAAGITATQVADQCKTSQPQISRLFTGYTKNPLFPLGMSIVDLFTTTFPGQPIPELATPTDSTPDSPPALAISAQGAMGCVAQGA